MINGKYKGKDLRGYDADFYNWTVGTLGADAQNLWIMDVDAVVRDRNDNFMLLEIKRNDYPPKAHQMRTIKIIHALIRAGMDATRGKVVISVNGTPETHYPKYLGYNLLQLDNTSFFNSTFQWNGLEITTDMLEQILQFKPLEQLPPHQLTDDWVKLKGKW